MSDLGQAIIESLLKENNSLKAENKSLKERIAALQLEVEEDHQFEATILVLVKENLAKAETTLRETRAYRISLEERNKAHMAEYNTVNSELIKALESVKVTARSKGLTPYEKLTPYADLTKHNAVNTELAEMFENAGL